MVMLLDLITLVLSIEFLVGMYLNVYVTLQPGTAQYENPFLLTHIILGVVLFALSILAVVYGYVKKIERSIVVMLIVSALLVLVTGIFGMLFLNTSNPIFTYLMAAFFLFIFAPVGFATSRVRKVKDSE